MSFFTLLNKNPTRTSKQASRHRGWPWTRLGNNWESTRLTLADTPPLHLGGTHQWCLEKVKAKDNSATGLTFYHKVSSRSPAQCQHSRSLCVAFQAHSEGLSSQFPFQPRPERPLTSLFNVLGIHSLAQTPLCCESWLYAKSSSL